MSEETDIKDFLKSVWEDPITEAQLDTFERQVMATGELMDGDVPIVSRADCHLHFPSLIMLRKMRLALEEITRLLAIEEKANKLDEALGWVMRDYEGMCREGYQASANWKKRVVMAKASATAFQRSINPIGDKK